MGSLAEFVEVWAPGLLGAVPARPGADVAKIDAEVAHLLAAAWLAGPPFADTLARSRRRLASGYAGGSTDLVDLGAVALSSPVAAVDGEPVTPDRVASVRAAVERTVERRARHAGLARVTQGLVAAALAVIVGLGGLQLLRANEGLRAGGSPSTSSTAAATAAPTVTPSADPTACPYSVCRWESVQDWTTQVKETVHSTLDPDSKVFGSTNPRPMVTTVAEVSRGRFLEAGFGSVVPASTSTYALTITVTTRRDLLPDCGASTGARCTRATTKAGAAVTSSTSAHAIEVFHRTDDGTWVHVLAESPGRIPFGRAALTRLATDPRLALPS